MRPIATDIAWPVPVRVCVSVTAVSCAKTAEPIEMRFWLWTRVDQRNHVFGGGTDPPR